jgi:hypothetical protein
MSGYMEMDATSANNIRDLHDCLFKANTDAVIGYFCVGCHNFGLFHKQFETPFCVKCVFRKEREHDAKQLGYTNDHSDAVQWNPYEDMMPAHVDATGTACLFENGATEPVNDSTVYPLARIYTRYTSLRLIEMLALTGVRFMGEPASTGDDMLVYADVEVITQANAHESKSDEASYD